MLDPSRMIGSSLRSLYRIALASCKVETAVVVSAVAWLAKPNKKLPLACGSMLVMLDRQMRIGTAQWPCSAKTHSQAAAMSAVR